MGRQRRAGEPGQNCHAGAPGTAMPAQDSPVLSPPPKKGSPQLQGARARLCWAAQLHITSVPGRAPPGLPSPAGTWRGPCG